MTDVGAARGTRRRLSPGVKRALQILVSVVLVGLIVWFLFGQFTKMDKELSLDDVLSIGARLGVYLLPNIAFEVDAQIGKTDWNSGAGVQSVTYSPIALRVIYAMPLAERRQAQEAHE